jgi:NSS family neurotransmitter:Na+ symporter
MPELFRTMPGGGFFMVIFFLALSFAAITSLIAMLELASRVLIDLGIARRRAVLWVAGLTLILGVPSALSLSVFNNQDWVWGVGLMLSGLFFAITASRFGLEKLRTKTVNGEGCDLQIGRWWVFVVGMLVPIEAITLIIWWLKDAHDADPEGWLAPFGSYTVGTVILQWSIALAALWLANGWLARRTVATRPAAADVGGDA